MKKAIITGHSKGLGRAMTQILLANSFHVLGLSRSGSGLTNEANLEEKAIDLSDTDSLLQYCESEDITQFLRGSGQALLINNAGIVDPISPIGRQNSETIPKAVSINITAPLMLTNTFILAAGGIPDCRVMHVSSGAARIPFQGWSVYGATKAAVDQHALGVVEDNVANVRICSLAPGIVDTNMQASIRGTKAEDFSKVERFKEFKANGELASPTDTATKMIAYMLEDRYGRETCADIRTV